MTELRRQFGRILGQVAQGQTFVITTDPSVVGDSQRVSTTYAKLAEDVEPGTHILLDDGLMMLEVTEVRGGEVVTVVRVGGVLKNNKGINLPDVDISAPSLTEKDRGDLAFGVRVGVDYVGLSFVRDPKDVLEARHVIQQKGATASVTRTSPHTRSARRWPRWSTRAACRRA